MVNTLEVGRQVEKIRRREVREGRLYDCPERLYAGIAQGADSSYCEGFRVGVGGHRTAQVCDTCRYYHLNAEKTRSRG